MGLYYSVQQVLKDNEMPKKKKRKRKSAKKAAIGRKLARRLPRDIHGKFLPLGSKNQFKKKRGAKRRRRKSVPAKRRRTTTKKKRRASVGSMTRRRGLKTADLYPNFLSGSIQTLATFPNTLVTQQVFTPLPRLKTMGNRATVLELLWLDIRATVDFALADADFAFQMSVGSPPSALLAWNDPRVFAEYFLASEGVVANGKSIFPMQPWRFQFQSLDGFGYLLASDSFNVTMLMSNGPPAPQTNIATWKLYYRFVDIPLSEFVGIVQSMQQT